MPRSSYQNPLFTLISTCVLLGVGLGFVSDGPVWRAILTATLIGLTNYWLLARFNRETDRSNMRRVIISVLGGGVIGMIVNVTFNFEPILEQLRLLPQFPLKYLHLPVQDLLHHLLNRFAVMISISSLVSTVMWAREHATRAEASYEREKAKTALQEKLLIESQLKMLQAQIEPHFLFNTLANLHSLIDSDPKNAKSMLAHLNDYLRASLLRTRAYEGTVRQELELLSAFLGILQIRMRDRLSYTIDCPDDLAGLPLAPMLLQPLVENAVKHGLEPKVEGGHIDVSVWRNKGLLKLSVSDNGNGLGQSAGGHGVALQNIRERLISLYGRDARLHISEQATGGVIATITLPMAL